MHIFQRDTLKGAADIMERVDKSGKRAVLDMGVKPHIRIESKPGENTEAALKSVFGI